MKSGLKFYLEQLLGENPNKTDLAKRCDVPYHVIVDIFREKVQRPDPEILEHLAAGLADLGVSYDDLALAAYGRLVKRSGPLLPDPASLAASPA